MDTTQWLIVATIAAPVLATLAAPGFTRAVTDLARARAHRVKHVDATGADLYHSGVPMNEKQFREMFATYQAALDELPPPAERSEWDLKRQFAAAQRLAVLTGTHPQAFPNFGDHDQAWQWYAENNSYATGRPTGPDVLGSPTAARPTTSGFFVLT